MQYITTSTTTATELITRAQNMLTSYEGRTLTFEASDELQRVLIAARTSLSEAPVVSLSEEEDALTDDEISEFEARLYYDSHADEAYWTAGGAR
jgi:hypothetical protein